MNSRWSSPLLWHRRVECWRWKAKGGKLPLKGSDGVSDDMSDSSGSEVELLPRVM